MSEPALALRWMMPFYTETEGWCNGPAYLVVLRAPWAKVNGAATWAFPAIFFESLKEEEELTRANFVAISLSCSAQSPPFFPFLSGFDGLQPFPA